MTIATAQEALIVRAGKGPAWWLIMDKMTLLVDAARTQGRFSVWEAICPPGGGPPPHKHSREDEMFYIIEGELTFTLFDQTIHGKPGTAVYLPAGSLHNFKNESSQPTRFIMISTADSFQAFVGELGFRLEDRPAPVPPDEKEVGRILACCKRRGIEMFLDHQASSVAPDKGPDDAYWVMGEHATFKLTSEQTKGNFGMFEVTSDVGGGVPMHSHDEMDEMFYILKGQYQFTINGQSHLLSAGDFAYVPAGIFHTFCKTGPEQGKMLDIHTPGGFENFFMDCGVKAEVGQPAPVVQPPPKEAIIALLAKHKMQVPSM